MKIRASLLLLAAAALFVFSCRDQEGPGPADNFRLKFKVLYDGQPLEKGKVYAYGDKFVSFDRFNIYLSDISLLKGNERTKLSDIEWLDFTGGPTSQAVDLSFRYGAPEGEYSAILLGFGVKPDLNAKSPADFAPGHPLANESEYWLGWKSYISSRIEGRFDSDGNGATETVIFYHCGSDATYNTWAFARDINLTDNYALTIEFDLKKLFIYDGQLLDLNVQANQTTSHSPTDITLGQKVMGNFKSTLTLK